LYALRGQAANRQEKNQVSLLARGRKKLAALGKPSTTSLAGKVWRGRDYAAGGGRRPQRTGGHLGTASGLTFVWASERREEKWRECRNLMNHSYQKLSVDDLRTCSDDCLNCPYRWAELAEEVCSETCIGDSICPWLMVCRCLNPNMSDRVGHRLERLVLSAPLEVQVRPVGVSVRFLRLDGRYDVRRRRSQEAVEELAQSIVTEGLFAPPGGVAAPDGFLDVVMGITRTRALLALGERVIPIRVFHFWGDTPVDRLVKAFQENAIRQEMTWDEEVRLVYRVWVETGRPSVRKLAGRLGKGRTWVHGRLQWGQKLWGEGPPSTPSPGPSRPSRQPSRSRPRGVYLTIGEVRSWLQTLGVPADGESPAELREALRKALADLVGRAEGER